MIGITVANLKGGTAKTTTAAYLLHALAETGLKVVGIDADGENQSLQRWSEMGEWKLPVIGMAVANIHTKLTVTLPADVDAFVIDTPPLKEHRGIVASAIRASNYVIAPIAPTPMEYDGVGRIAALVEELQPLQVEPAKFAFLFTRTIYNATSAEAYPDMLRDAGYLVLNSRIPRLEKFGQAFGDHIDNALATGYGDAIEEILNIDT